MEGVACHYQSVNGTVLFREPLCEEMFYFNIDSKNYIIFQSFKVEVANVKVRAC